MFAAARHVAARSAASPQGGERDVLPAGRTALQPPLQLALRYAADQGLLPRPLDVAELWEGLPPGVG
jgi:4,5-dihydroxyphthalate decarboxylase